MFFIEKWFPSSERLGVSNAANGKGGAGGGGKGVMRLEWNGE